MGAEAKLIQTAGQGTKRILTDSPPLFVYALTVLVSSSLVFWIQPLAVRGLLPVMGGAPVVWNTGMLFFQGTLLLGYLLSHLLDRRLSGEYQIVAFGGLWLLALISVWTGGLGYLMGDTPPNSGVVLPVLWVLGSLALTYGLGCLAVSMVSPLVSSWLSRAQDSVDPYVLYAVSNAASIGILLLYPFVLEPLFGVRVQIQAWHLIFALLLILLGQLFVNVPGYPGESRTVPAPSASRMSRGAAIRVVILSLLPGALLHGVTLSLSTDVASTPFLWVAPLALYLGTYALAFGRRQTFARWRGALSAGPLPAGLILFAVLHGFTDMGLWWGVFHLLLFGLVALWCHGLLWELRPPGEDLTRFYVLIASGGLLGGVLSVLIFPLVFTEVWEYPLLFALAALCLPKPEAPGDGNRPSVSQPSARRLACMALSALAAALAVPCLHVNQFPVWLRLGAVLLLGVSLPGLWSLRSWPRWMAAALLLISFTPVLSWPLRGGEMIARERTWFGVYRVVDMDTQGEMPGRLRLFFHGTTLHGTAWVGQGGVVRNRTGYFVSEGPYGDVMRGLKLKGSGALRLGVVGLGVGSLLCYAQPGDTVSVWEIDPAVVTLARTHFTALEDCAPEAAVHTGDGRLLIRGEAPGSFDALFLDAFSSGSIPVHLLTMEALEDYLRVLEPGGVLAIHISNRHLDLEPLLGLAAHELGLAGAVRLYTAPHWAEHEALPMMTHLAVLARDASVIEDLELGDAWQPLEPRQPTWWRRAWTDDASSLVPYLR